MEISLAVSIFLGIVLALLAIAFSRKASVCLVILLVTGYIATQLNSIEALLPLIASAMLWLATAIISIRRNLVGITRRDIENSGALASIPFLVFSATLLFEYPGYGAFGILTWFLLWYYLKDECKSLRPSCLLFLYIPTALLIVLYRTPIAIVYGICTLWLQSEIKALQNSNRIEREHR